VVRSCIIAYSLQDTAHCAVVHPKAAGDFLPAAAISQASGPLRLDHPDRLVPEYLCDLFHALLGIALTEPTEQPFIEVPVVYQVVPPSAPALQALDFAVKVALKEPVLNDPILGEFAVGVDSGGFRRHVPGVF
jgi:hypothetical protein